MTNPETSASTSSPQTERGARHDTKELPDAIATNDYHEAYRANYDATYGSPRQIGISGVQPQPPCDEDEVHDRAEREHEHDRAVRREQERIAVDAVSTELIENRRRAAPS
jgi:neutral trehalase